jgi:hypothetical protein
MRLAKLTSGTYSLTVREIAERIACTVHVLLRSRSRKANDDPKTQPGQGNSVLYILMCIYMRQHARDIKHNRNRLQPCQHSSSKATYHSMRQDYRNVNSAVRWTS